MPKRYHDTAQVDTDWWIELSPIHKSLLAWIEKKHETSGIYDVQLAKFCADWWHRSIKPKDIDLKEFCKECNLGGKERMILIDGGDKLFYSTTIKFQEAKRNSDHVQLVNNFNHRGILNQLAGYKETREWLIGELKRGSFKIAEDLLFYMIQGASIPKSISDYYTKISGILRQDNPIERMDSKNDAIKKRDKYTCQYCHKVDESVFLEIDHIVPQSRGGDNFADNLITSCVSCNNKKSDDNIFEFINKYKLTPTNNVFNRINSLIKRKKIPTTLADKYNYPNNYPIGLGLGLGQVSSMKESIPLKEENEKKEKKKKSNSPSLLDAESGNVRKSRRYTYSQMLSEVEKNGRLTVDDFQVTDEVDRFGKKYWVKKI